MKLIDFKKLPKLSIVAVMITGIVGSAAFAPVEARADTPAAEQAKDDTKTKKRKKKREKKICKRVRVTGSHMKQKVCQTQAEIDARREADQQMINDINPSGVGGPSQ